MSIGKKIMDFIVPTKITEVEIEIPADPVEVAVRPMHSSNRATYDSSVHKPTSDDGIYPTDAINDNGLGADKSSYGTTNIKTLIETAKLESREWHNLLKRSVKIILAHRELKSLDETTLPKIADDLALILQASDIDAATMLADINTLKKTVRDGVNQNLKAIGEYRNKKGYEINTLIARLKQLEQEVNGLDKIMADDTQNMNDTLDELESYSKMLELVSKMKTQSV